LDTACSELEKLISPADAKAEASQLSIDASLNAQGIAWWSQQAQRATN